MYLFCLILVAFLTAPSCAIPVDFDQSSDYPYDYYNSYYQPSFGSDLLNSLYPFSKFESVNYPHYLASSAVGSDLLSTVPADFAYNYPYASARTVNVDKENYVRDYGFGSTEVGVRNQVSTRSNVPSLFLPNYLISTAVVGSDLLSTVPADFANDYLYAPPRIVNVAKENYVRDYGYGSAEVGVRNQLSVRSNAPDIPPLYTRACSIFPIGKCRRGTNRFNQQSNFPVLPINYDVVF